MLRTHGASSWRSRLRHRIFHQLVLSTLRIAKTTLPEQQKINKKSGNGDEEKVSEASHTNGATSAKLMQTKDQLELSTKEQYVRVLRMKLFLFFGILLFMDILIGIGYIIGVVFSLVQSWIKATNGIIYATISIHLFLSFRFLDYLLDRLNEIKRLKPVNSDRKIDAGIQL